MSQLAFILPYPELSEITKNVIENYEDNIIVETALLNEAIDIALSLDRQGVKVIIARGGTDLILERLDLDCKIIELKITEYDVISSLLSARKYGDNIGFVGFNNMYERIEEIAKLLNINLIKKIIKDEEQTPQLLDEIEAEVDVVIGGVITTRWAETKNINHVLIETTESTIKNTINEAFKMIEFMSEEKKKRKEIQEILNLVDEGIIAINKDENINYINNSAAKIYKVNLEEALGKNIKKLNKNIKLGRVLKTRKKEVNQICQIHEKLYNISRVPITINNEIIGAIKLLNDVSKIEKIEHKVRKEIYAKGYYARYHFSDIIGESEIIKKNITKAKRYGEVDSNLLIYGETGSGKEIFAQSIHNISERSCQPFVAVNCAAIPEKLLESELFGYEGGAFTGAKKGGKKGLFELAHQGTIFLDEISEMAPKLQARLLRVLQESRVRRIGGDQFIPVDLRLIAATNKQLKELITENKFRSDLYFRLNVLSLNLPSLRNRGSDVEIYANYFLGELSEKLNKNGMYFTDEALRVLNKYDWPGNVRELKNVVERCAVLTKQKKITAKIIEDLIDFNKEVELAPELDSVYEISDDLIGDQNLENIIGELEKYIIKTVLNKNAGNKTITANELGINRTTLWRKLKE